jgi:hypothetical protein
MSEVNRPAEQSSFLEEPHKMPDMINVLTILTFIGSGLFALVSLWGFAKAKANYDMATTMDVDKMPGFMKNMMGADYVEKARIAYENRVPLLLLALLGYAACIYGAIQMRQLKKNGFYVYAIGEIVIPLITLIVFTGMSSITSLGTMIGLCIYSLFIVIYATQLKYLR